MGPRSVLVSLVAILAVAPAARGQSPLHQLTGQPGDGLGAAVLILDDLDGDGAAEFAVGAGQNADVLFPLSGCGCVRIHSGRTGAVLQTWTPTAADPSFGGTLADAGDQDGDGLRDVAVASIAKRIVQVRSSATGAVLRTLPAPNPFILEFGAVMDAVGDLNGDGRAELLVGGPGTDQALAAVFDVATGQVLQQYTLAWVGITDLGSSEFGRAVSRLGDVDLDGVPDHAVADPGVLHDGGYVFVLSGATHLVLAQRANPSASVPASTYGSHLDDVGDLDGDGVPDLLVGSPGQVVDGVTRGAVEVLAGATLTPLLTLHGEEHDVVGAHATAVGDVDCDGIVHFAYVSGAAVAARVHSGADGALLAVGPPLQPSAVFDPWLGLRLAGGGDVNGDGFLDLIAGNPQNQFGAGNGVVSLATAYDGTVAPVGDGCVGSGGFTPRLVVRSCGTPGTPSLTELTQGLGGAPAFFFFGVATTDVPLTPTCSFHVAPIAPPLFSVPLAGVGPGAGTVAFGGVVPPGLAGVTVSRQAFVLDPGVPRGYSATRAVTLALH